MIVTRLADAEFRLEARGGLEPEGRLGGVPVANSRTEKRNGKRGKSCVELSSGMEWAWRAGVAAVLSKGVLSKGENKPP